MSRTSMENTNKKIRETQEAICRLGYYVALAPRNTRDSEFVDYVSPDSFTSIAWLEKRLAVVSRRQEAYEQFMAKDDAGLVSVFHSDFFWASSGVADIETLVRLASTCRHFTRLLLNKDIWTIIFQNMSVVWQRHLFVVDQYKAYLIQRQQCLAFYRKLSRDTLLMRLNNFIDFEREDEIRAEIGQSRGEELARLQTAFDNIATEADVDESKAWMQTYDNLYFCGCATTITAAIFRSRASPSDMLQSSLATHNNDMAVFLWHQYCNPRSKALSKSIMEAYNVKVGTVDNSSDGTLDVGTAPTMEDWEAIYGSLRYDQQAKKHHISRHGDGDQGADDPVVEERRVKRVKNQDQ